MKTIITLPQKIEVGIIYQLKSKVNNFEIHGGFLTGTLKCDWDKSSIHASMTGYVGHDYDQLHELGYATIQNFPHHGTSTVISQNSFTIPIGMYNLFGCKFIKHQPSPSNIISSAYVQLLLEVNDAKVIIENKELIDFELEQIGKF
jgi:hypothetical protein